MKTKKRRKSFHARQKQFMTLHNLTTLLNIFCLCNMHRIKTDPGSITPYETHA